MLGSTQKGTDMSTLAGNKRKRGIQVKDGTVKIVKLDIGENFEHILENHSITWRGKKYYPVCLAYRLMEDQDLSVCKDRSKQIQMAECCSRHFFISRDANVIRKKFSKRKGWTTKEIAFFIQERRYRRAILHFTRPGDDEQESKTWKWPIFLHRLMMLTFDPIWDPDNPEIQVHHIKRKDGVAEYYYEEPNEDKTNLTVPLNHLKHLKWITAKENSQRCNQKPHKSSHRMRHIYPIIAIHKETKEETRFESVNEACEQLSILHAPREYSPQDITRVLRGARKSSKGYKYIRADPSLPGEEWRSIKFSNTRISSFGRVQTSHTIHYGCDYLMDGGLVYKRSKMEIKNPGKYTKQHEEIHRKVYEAFLGTLPEKGDRTIVVNHKDGFGQHNCIMNLELISQSENCVKRGCRQLYSGICEYCGFDRSDPDRKLLH